MYSINHVDQQFYDKYQNSIGIKNRIVAKLLGFNQRYAGNDNTKNRRQKLIVLLMYFARNYFMLLHDYF